MGWEDIILLSLFELSRAHQWFPESITVNGPAQYTQYIHSAANNDCRRFAN
jgi:hypothetical protein